MPYLQGGSGHWSPPVRIIGKFDQIRLSEISTNRNDDDVSCATSFQVCLIFSRVTWVPNSDDDDVRAARVKAARTVQRL